MRAHSSFGPIFGLAFGAAALLSPLLAAPVQAQQSPAPMPGTPANSSNLTVATVKLESGWRASRMIGASVDNDQGAKIGTIDDLIVGSDNKLMNAVISVGGFLGIGSKLVAVPYTDLRVGQDMKVTLPGATKESLNGMPSFTYGT